MPYHQPVGVAVSILWWRIYCGCFGASLGAPAGLLTERGPTASLPVSQGTAVREQKVKQLLGASHWRYSRRKRAWSSCGSPGWAMLDALAARRCACSLRARAAGEQQEARPPEGTSGLRRLLPVRRPTGAPPRPRPRPRSPRRRRSGSGGSATSPQGQEWVAAGRAEGLEHHQSRVPEVLDVVRRAAVVHRTALPGERPWRPGGGWGAGTPGDAPTSPGSSACRSSPPLRGRQQAPELRRKHQSRLPAGGDRPHHVTASAGLLVPCPPCGPVEFPESGRSRAGHVKEPVRLSGVEGAKRAVRDRAAELLLGYPCRSARRATTGAELPWARRSRGPRRDALRRAITLGEVIGSQGGRSLPNSHESKINTKPRIMQKPPTARPFGP